MKTIDGINKEIVKFEILLSEKKALLNTIVKGNDISISNFGNDGSEIDGDIFKNRIAVVGKEIENAQVRLAELKSRRLKMIQEETEIEILMEEIEKKYIEQNSIESMDMGD